jgi:hypothetical protein
VVIPFESLTIASDAFSKSIGISQTNIDLMSDNHQMVLISDSTDISDIELSSRQVNPD